MQLKDRLNTSYSKFVNSTIWDNALLGSIKPVLKPVGRLSIRVLNKFIKIASKIRGRARYYMHRAVPRALIDKYRYYTSPTARTLQRARKAASENRWTESKSEYLKLRDILTRQNINEIEIDNEISMNLSLISRLSDITSYKKNLKRKSRKRPIALVMAVSGGYDSIKPPETLHDDVDYILYTDSPVNSYGIYDVRPLPYHQHEPTRMARYIKTNLDRFTKGYDYAIWMDANIMPVKDIDPLIKSFIASKKPIAAIPHPQRNSVYQEEIEIKKRSKDNPAVVSEQIQYLRSEKLEHNDLIESNFMMFDLRNKGLGVFFREWWRVLDRYSRRDQLGLNYAMQSAGLEWHRIFKKPVNTRTSDYFAITGHDIKLPALDALQADFQNTVVDPSVHKKDFSRQRKKITAFAQTKTIDIIYCVHNALDDVIKCLDSVEKHRKKNANLIIIDDGSANETRDYLRSFTKGKSWVTLDRSKTGSGYTKAANRGLRLSKADVGVLLNSDTIVTKDWTDKLIHAAFSGENVGIVGPLSSAASHQSLPNIKSSAGQTAVNDLPDHVSIDMINSLLESEASYGYYPQTPLMHGFCFAIRKDARENLGLFDEEKFAKGYGEENDYCMRANNMGIDIVLATNTYIYHAKSKSYTDDSKRQKLMNAGVLAQNKLHGQERFRRAVLSMQTHPELIRLREKVSELYRSKD